MSDKPPRAKVRKMHRLLADAMEVWFTDVQPWCNAHKSPDRNDHEMTMHLLEAATWAVTLQVEMLDAEANPTL